MSRMEGFLWNIYSFPLSDQAMELMKTLTLVRKEGLPWKEDSTINGLFLAPLEGTLLLQLTTPLSQPTVNDSGHQDVPCHLMALDGSSLGRERNPSFSLYDHFSGGFPQCSSGLSDEGLHTNQGHTMPSKRKGH